MIFKFIYNVLLIRKIILVNLLAVSFFQLIGQASNFPEVDGVQLHPRWVDNLMFLRNVGDGISIKDEGLYSWAATYLSDNPNRGFGDLTSYTHFQNYCKEHGIYHLGGPMIGNITEESADVWIRTVKPSEIKIEVDFGKETKAFGPIHSTEFTELSGVVPIHGLAAGTEYHYKVFVDDVELNLPYSTIIKTFDKSNKTRIGFGSCFHRWGLGNPRQNTTILSRETDAFLGLGDIVTQDRFNHLGWHSLDYLARDLYPAWRSLVGQVPFYALWDDHDYFGDDKWGIPPGYSIADREKVWRAFRYSWNNPTFGFDDDRKGVFFHNQIGNVDVITVDHRYFRTKESFLGEDQMNWLKKELLACKSPFIILACGSMWSDHVSGGKDSWGVFDAEGREELFDFIEKNNISGVLLVSGDRHGSRGFKIERPSGYVFYEFEVASLGGLAGPPANAESWTGQFYGISGGFAYGEFVFDTNLKDPTVTFSLVDQNSEALYKLKLKRSELTPDNH